MATAAIIAMSDPQRMAADRPAMGAATARRENMIALSGMSHERESGGTRRRGGLTARIPAERQFASVADLHPLLRTMVAHALDVTEQPLQPGGAVKRASAGRFHGPFGNTQNAAAHQCAINKNAVRRVGAGFQRKRFHHVTVRDSRPGEISVHLAEDSHHHTTSEQFGTIAAGQRQWAQLSPWAQMKRPMTLEDHHNSPFIAEPLQLLDCCLVSNGAVAVVVTSSERARDFRQPPVNVLGYAQCAQRQFAD
jgi:hypothetical protein